MIKVSLTALVFLYLLGLGGTILLFWFLLEKMFAKPGSIRRETPSLLRCEICLHDFVDSGTGRYVTCPLCGSLLEREKAAVRTPGEGAEE